MKSVSLVQVNFQQGPNNCASYYLPYSVGCLWSYAYSFKSIIDNYKLGHVIWRRDPIEKTAQKLSTEDIVVFSCYVWNRIYNYTLAKRIKELNPNCFIIFGGPEPAITDPDIFKLHPYIDVIIMLEGEFIFKNLLENINCPESVAGMLINKNLQVINTGDAERIADLSVLPSPYLTGFFDNIIASAPEVKEWAATIETNRGCPYACTFCDWGSLTYNKVKKINLERIFAELEWVGKNKCGWLALTDANFGIFVERDNIIADKIVEVQNQFGYPSGFTVSYAKNQKKEVVEIVEKLIKGSLTNSNQGLQISLQTLDDNVLDIIKRKNLDLQNCEEVIQLAAEKNIPIGTEIILGLPGESLVSWKNNLHRLLDLGIHENIDIWYCQLLENAEMSKVQKEIYNIKTTTVYDYFSLAQDNHDDTSMESVQITIATDSLPFNDWIEASVVNWFYTTFHLSGFSDIVSRFFKKKYNIEFAKFYDEFYKFLLEDPWFTKQLTEYKQLLHHWVKDGYLAQSSICDVRLLGWNVRYLGVMTLHSSIDHRQHYFKKLEEFIRRFELPEVEKSTLLTLQENMTVNIDQVDQYPITETFDLNIYDYVVNDAKLTNTSHSLLFSFPETTTTRTEFLERLYFGRRRRFGRTWITKNDY
jgi:tRNA A37 methylthiotransferase MiaB